MAAIDRKDSTEWTNQNLRWKDLFSQINPALREDVEDRIHKVFFTVKQAPISYSTLWYMQFWNIFSVALGFSKNVGL